jgi:hypothetical protein
MKKFFVASVFLGVASMAQAAFIQCAPAQADTVVNAGGVTANYTCNTGAGGGAGSVDDNLNGDNYFIQTVRVQISGTFQENNGTPGANFSVLFTTNNIAVPAAIGVLSCTANGVAGAPPASTPNQALGACTATSAFSAVAGGPDSLASFGVSVTGGPGSNPLPFNASASVFYEVTATTPTTPPPGIPEPSTYGMIGAGLLSFCLVRRRS